MKPLKAIHKAVYEPIADLVTYRVMPTDTVPMNMLDPFIFLNHHGHQIYHPVNAGLPFGPHPHRGFETVTFILEGDLTHKDSGGSNSIIKAGGVQWMTAGSGLIHAEISSDEFMAQGGPLEILQLWVNLPAKFKMTEPKYTGLQKSDIPEMELDNGKVKVNIVAGNWFDQKAAFTPLTDIHLISAELREGGKLEKDIPQGNSIFLYTVKGAITVNGTHLPMHYLAEFEKGESHVEITAETDAVILFGFATPFNEPFIAYGPFVMNTEAEIRQAYDDYRKGKLGPFDL